LRVQITSPVLLAACINVDSDSSPSDTVRRPLICSHCWDSSLTARLCSDCKSDYACHLCSIKCRPVECEDDQSYRICDRCAQPNPKTPTSPTSSFSALAAFKEPASTTSALASSAGAASYTSSSGLVTTKSSSALAGSSTFAASKASASDSSVVASSLAASSSSSSVAASSTVATSPAALAGSSVLAASKPSASSSSAFASSVAFESDSDRLVSQLHALQPRRPWEPPRDSLHGSVISIRGDGHCVDNIVHIVQMLLLDCNFLSKTNGLVVCFFNEVPKLRNLVKNKFNEWCTTTHGSSRNTAYLEEQCMNLWGETPIVWRKKNASEHGHALDIALFFSASQIGVVVADICNPKSIYEGHLQGFFPNGLPAGGFICVVASKDHWDLAATTGVRNGKSFWQALWSASEWPSARDAIFDFLNSEEALEKVGSGNYVIPEDPGMLRKRRKNQ
jgi:hypothetical protein